MIDSLYARAVGVVCLLLLLAPTAATAAEPQVAEPQVLGQTAARDDRPCVLMTNQNVLFGTAHQRGEYVIVRRDDDSEIQLNRQDVACWAKSLRGLYQFRLAHRRGSGLDVHLESARWCLRYQLFDLAIQELQAATRIDPGNQSIQLLAQQVRRAQQATAEGVRAPDPSKPMFEPNSVQVASYDASLSVEEEFDAATLQQFARRVQPLLMNRCGSCHTQHSERAWQLDLTASGSRASARMTKANLAATMPYVNADRPLESELYLRAIDGHAGKKVTLGPLATVPTRSLMEWLKRVRQINEWPKQGADLAASSEPAAAVVQTASHTAPKTEMTGNKPTGVQRLPAVTNPFDPELFNRRYARDAKAKKLLRAETK
jgi:hypothetical protein